jgi:antitoxin YokJ
MNINAVIRLLAGTPDCRLLPATGLPRTKSNVKLPEDLLIFYHAAGGAVLFESAPFPHYIVRPEALVLANPVIVGQLCPDDISSSWYTLAHDGNGDFLTIDLASERIGRCHDSFHETHGLIGQTPVIATSFSDLLSRLLANRGGRPYWLKPEFKSLGDAYEKH